MSRSPELDAKMKEATRQRILETAIKLFAEKTIDAVNMVDIAKEAKVSQGTVYRLFDKKPDLVLSVGAWVWEQYRKENTITADKSGMTAAEVFAYYLEAFINLYRKHRDALCFNQYFNAYVKREGVPPDRMKPYMDVIDLLKESFHQNYLLGQRDGTLRTDVPEAEMFSATLHLMLATVTRYAVGLVYDIGIDPEKELELLKQMLIREYTLNVR